MSLVSIGIQFLVLYSSLLPCVFYFVGHASFVYLYLFLVWFHVCVSHLFFRTDCHTCIIHYLFQHLNSQVSCLPYSLHDYPMVKQCNAERKCKKKIPKPSLTVTVTESIINSFVNQSILESNIKPYHFIFINIFDKKRSASFFWQ